jgi:tetratricopeptide (TPR) repeat protein
MLSLWRFIRNAENRAVLAWCGGGIVAVAAAAWPVFVHFFPPPDATKPAPSTTITQSGNAIASGRDTIVSGGQFNLGLDEKKTAEAIAKAQKPLADQLERLAIQVAQEKGVPVAPLRAILLKLGEAGVSDEDLPRRLDAMADEILRLRDEIAQDKQGPQELASFAQQAQTLIDQGDIAGASKVLAEGRASAHKLREQSSRYEANFLAQEARVDHLQISYKSAAEKYQEAASLIAGFDPHRQWQLLLDRAGELYSQGDQFGDNEALMQAIAADRDAVSRANRDGAPRDWARAQNSLGLALLSVGRRDTDNTHLEGAVTAFRAALEERTRERMPLLWAQTQSNLGGALWRLGERDQDTARFEEAVAAYRAALQEQTRERVPLQWAWTQNRLGLVLKDLALREDGTARIGEAIAAFRAALQEITRERLPLQWARIQTNLGIGLGVLGARENDTAHLEEAIATFRAALEVQARDRVPLDWAMTQNFLGVALSRLGRRENDMAHLEEAVGAYHNALQEYTSERSAFQWALTQNNLGDTLRTLGERETGTAHFEQAIAAYNAALSANPSFSETIRVSLAQAEALLAQRRQAAPATP